MRGIAVAVLVLSFADAHGQAVPVATKDTCEAMLHLDLSAVPDAPSKVTGAEVVEATSEVRAHCRIQGYVRSNVKFELRLPLTAWNGKHLMRGCGGFCGAVLPRCDGALNKGYACIASDMGHFSTGLDAQWAWNNREAELDFSHRATHVTAVVGKTITARFYRSSVTRSYYEGCSTGGRQGLVSAQRFPDDFDGIIAGAPVINETGAGVQLLWSVRAARRPDGIPILEPDDVRALHAAVLAQCDALDGVADGILADPRACRPDLSRIRCETVAAEKNCLSAEQTEAVRKIYEGPVDSRGRALYTGGAMPGSELNWIGPYVAPRGETPSYYTFIGDLFRYLAFAEDPGPDWRPEHFDFDRDPSRLGFMEQLFTGSNPDLRRFRDRGGKLILYQGWSDQSVVPLNVIDYYELMARAMGGADEAGKFARLFMVPGMNHCAGGVGATEFDFLTALEEWVEQGRAPSRLIGAKRDDGRVVLKRPILPYPRVPKYRRGADPTKPESFR